MSEQPYPTDPAAPYPGPDQGGWPAPPQHAQQPFPPGADPGWDPTPQGWGAPPPGRGPRRAGRRPVSRRKVLAITGGALAALIAAATGIAATRHAASPAGANGAAGWDPNTLPTPAGGGGIATGDVQALLDRHNTALARRDESGFLAAFDPASNAAAGAKVLFANLGKIPFDHARYELIGQGSRVFPGADGASATVDVSFTHQVSGVDLLPVPEWYRWTLTRKTPASPLLITAVTGSPAVAGEAKWVYFPAVWDLGTAITVINRPNLVLATANAKDAAIMAGVADLAQQALRENLAAWKQGNGASGVSPGLFITGTSDTDTMFALYSGRDNDHGHEAGLTTEIVAASSIDSITTKRVVGGARIAVLLTSDYFTQNNSKHLFKHEGAHALWYTLLTALAVPLWVMEGGAEHWASRDQPAGSEVFLPALRRYLTGSGNNPWSGTWDGHSLPTDGEVYAADGTEMAANYELASLAFRLIEQRSGLAGVCAFIAANYRSTAPGDTNGADDVNAALRTSVGLDLPGFLKVWAPYIHATVGA